MERKAKIKAGCGIAAVFGAGVLCGALGLFLFLVRIIPLSEGWRNEESKEFVTGHLSRQLDLSDDQIERLRPIIRESLDQRYERRKAYIESDIAITEAAFEKAIPSLTDTQKEKAKKILNVWKRGKERFLQGSK